MRAHVYDMDEDNWLQDRTDPEAPKINGEMSRLIQSRDLEGLRALLIANPGTDLDMHGPDLDTPLHVACWRGEVECAKILLSNGASASVMNRDGFRPIDCLIHSIQLMDDSDTTGALIRLLAAHGASIDEAGLRNPRPFLAACQAVNLAAARTLVELGADPWSQNDQGENAFDILETKKGRWPRGPRRDSGFEVGAARENFLGWLESLWENQELSLELGTDVASPSPEDPRSRRRSL